MRLPPSEGESSGPNLTPVIDIVFILIIFFLVATQFAQREKLVSIKLAEILQAEPLSAGAREVIINIAEDGTYNINGEEYDEAQLIHLLHQVNVNNPGNRRVQIRADENVKFRYPLTVIGICKQEGMEYSCTVLEEK